MPIIGATTEAIRRSLLTTIGDMIYASAVSTPARLAAVVSGQVLTAQGVGVAPAWAAAGAGDYPKKLLPAVTRWWIPGWYAPAGASTAVIAGTIYYIPIFVEETTTYIRIGISVATLDAGTTDLRIFNWTNGLPGSLVLSAGTVDTGTTGDKEITISQQLTRGYYFLAHRSSATPALTGPSTTWAISTPVSGISPQGYGAAQRPILSVSAAYTDPAPAPTAIADAVFAMVVLRDN